MSTTKRATGMNFQFEVPFRNIESFIGDDEESFVEQTEKEAENQQRNFSKNENGNILSKKADESNEKSLLAQIEQLRAENKKLSESCAQKLRKTREEAEEESLRLRARVYDYEKIIGEQREEVSARGLLLSEKSAALLLAEQKLRERDFEVENKYAGFDDLNRYVSDLFRDKTRVDELLEAKNLKVAELGAEIEALKKQGLENQQEKTSKVGKNDNKTRDEKIASQQENQHENENNVVEKTKSEERVNLKNFGEGNLVGNEMYENLVLSNKMLVEKIEELESEIAFLKRFGPEGDYR